MESPVPKIPFRQAQRKPRKIETEEPIASSFYRKSKAEQQQILTDFREKVRLGKIETNRVMMIWFYGLMGLIILTGVGLIAHNFIVVHQIARTEHEKALERDKIEAELTARAVKRHEASRRESRR